LADTVAKMAGVAKEHVKILDCQRGSVIASTVIMAPDWNAASAKLKTSLMDESGPFKDMGVVGCAGLLGGVVGKSPLPAPQRTQAQDGSTDRLEAMEQELQAAKKAVEEAEASAAKTRADAEESCKKWEQAYAEQVREREEAGEREKVMMAEREERERSREREREQRHGSRERERQERKEEAEEAREALCQQIATLIKELSLVKVELEATEAEREKEGTETTAMTQRTGTVMAMLRAEISAMNAELETERGERKRERNRGMKPLHTTP
jgi:hypothetical protein